MKDDEAIEKQADDEGTSDESANDETPSESESSKSEPSKESDSSNDGAPDKAKGDDTPVKAESDDEPAKADSDDESEEDRPSTVEVEVEPEPVESEQQAPHHHTHKPPPPPSVRARGGTTTLSVDGDPKIARDLMTRKLFTIEPDDIIAKLEEQMEAFRFRHLPVVREDKLVGLITHSDLLHASSSFLSEAARQRDEVIHKLPAHRIMQKEVITVRPDDTLAEVAHLMWEARIGCVLVTEEDDTLVGIITEGDFIRLAHHHLTRSEEKPEAKSA